MAKFKKRIFTSVALFVLFVIFTVLLKVSDVKRIGPCETLVGFATLNEYFHNFTGVNMYLYYLTDYLSLIPLFVISYFALLGLAQWMKRKSFLKVDRGILITGVFYVVVFMTYLFFETVVVNYRPILIDGCLEASYPSSTTMLVTCVMITLMFYLNGIIKSKTIKNLAYFLIVAFIAFMVIARIASGVHWLTDIVGGLLISTSLITIYSTFYENKQ